ncbi:MAG: hypothetical protein Kow00111_06510 [Thermincola ferriacetica]
MRKFNQQGKDTHIIKSILPLNKGIVKQDKLKIISAKQEIVGILAKDRGDTCKKFRKIIKGKERVK